LSYIAKSSRPKHDPQEIFLPATHNARDLMKISVIIPAFNAAATIGATLDAVLSQTLSPHEILVFDDGSTDDTAIILKSYGPRVTVFRQSNHGAAYARNFLCEQARGDVLAFLDADDLWHPRYLEVQHWLVEQHPDAVAYFTEHENIFGDGWEWPNGANSQAINPEVISPEAFIRRYDKTPMSFQMSCFCIRKSVLARLGKEPFRVSGAEDTFLHNTLPLLGPVVHAPVRLAAYRVNETSLSSNRLKVSLLVVDAFELLDALYKSNGNVVLYRAFRGVHASRRRNCGKFLMGTRRVPDARKQFLLAARMSRSLASFAKSMGLYCLTHFPNSLQPQWPAGQRVLHERNLKSSKGLG
jgi:glycosyltransferase involved in cell wall biosynthesis